MVLSRKIMLRSRRILGLALFLAAALLLPVSDGAAQTPQKTPAPASHKAKQGTKKTAPVAEAPQVPVAPPTLEQQAPTAPQVTFTNGQLTINSSNSTLSQVLQSVQAKTGASVDIPPGAGNERVVASLGPGKPQNVLASLLNGSKFNYVILGQANNPGAVQKVILMAKVAGSSTSSPAPTTSPQNTFRALPPGQQQPVEPPEDEYQPNEPDAEIQNQPIPGQPGGDVASQEVIQPGNRTPEQMLLELQQMQQQQQQMQQQLNPSNQQPFGQPVAPQNQQPGTPFPSQPPVSPQPQ
jgi:hypothetical protein